MGSVLGRSGEKALPEGLPFLAGQIVSKQLISERNTRCEGSSRGTWVRMWEEGTSAGQGRPLGGDGTQAETCGGSEPPTRGVGGGLGRGRCTGLPASGRDPDLAAPSHAAPAPSPGWVPAHPHPSETHLIASPLVTPGSQLGQPSVWHARHAVSALPLSPPRVFLVLRAQLRACLLSAAAPPAIRKGLLHPSSSHSTFCPSERPRFCVVFALVPFGERAVSGPALCTESIYRLVLSMGRGDPPCPVWHSPAGGCGALWASVLLWGPGRLLVLSPGSPLSCQHCLLESHVSGHFVLNPE